MSYHNTRTLLLCILQTLVWTVVSKHGVDSNNEYSSRTRSSHHYHELRRGFIPNIEITDAYLRDHSPVMPLLEEESQKRTTLREKELNFYGHLNVDRSLTSAAKTMTAKHSELKEKGESKKDNKTEDSKKAPYGR